MSKGIPYFRHVTPTDDGCTVYECLMCKNQWESRTAPRYDWPDIPQWKYCPYCGCQWAGEKKWDADNKWKKNHGKCFLAVAERARTERLRPLKFKIIQRFYPANQNGGFDDPLEWKDARSGCPTAEMAIEYLREKRAEEEDDEDGTRHFLGKTEYRAIPDGVFMKWREVN